MPFIVFGWHIRSRGALLWELLVRVVYIVAGFYLLLNPVAVTGPSFCTTASERVYITEPGKSCIHVPAAVPLSAKQSISSSTLLAT
jgi:hypothetical protein